MPMLSRRVATIVGHYVPDTLIVIPDTLIVINEPEVCACSDAMPVIAASRALCKTARHNSCFQFYLSVSQRNRAVAIEVFGKRHCAISVWYKCLCCKTLIRAQVSILCCNRLLVMFGANRCESDLKVVVMRSVFKLY